MNSDSMSRQSYLIKLPMYSCRQRKEHAHFSAHEARRSRDTKKDRDFDV